MKRSGYDEPDPNPDWAMRDEEFATIEERDFVHKEFQPIPALVSRANPGHWRRYHGQPFEEAEWELVAEMWDHEHCKVCFHHIEPGMTYWASSKDTFLCDRCYDRYLRPPDAVALTDDAPMYSLGTSEGWVICSFNEYGFCDFVEDVLTERYDGLEPLGMREVSADNHRTVFELHFDRSVDQHALREAVDAACAEFRRSAQ